MQIGKTCITLAAYRGNRAAWVHGEVHWHAPYGYVQFGIANPAVHAWWAVTVYIYVRRG